MWRLLVHLYRLEGEGLWAKHMGLKWGAIGNVLGEHIGNLENILRTWWEPIGNLKGTCWEQRKNEKKSSFPPTQNLKEKRIKALWVHAEPSHWLHEISISKITRHHFWPRLIPPIIYCQLKGPFAIHMQTFHYL
jgi:hypothetical protein